MGVRQLLLICLLFSGVVSFGQPMSMLLQHHVAAAPAWTHTASVIINHNDVGSVNSTNFTLPYYRTNIYFATVANGGAVVNTVVQSNGVTCPADLEIFSDAGLTTKLQWMVRQWNSTTGEIELWVLISTLHHTGDDTFYIAVGNSLVVAFQGGTSPFVTEGNFVLKQPLPDGTTLTAPDESGNGNSGTLINSPTATAGIIGGAGAFGGTKSITTTQTGFPTSNNSFTFSAWVYPTSSLFQVLYYYGSDATSNDFYIEYNATTGGFDIGHWGSTWTNSPANHPINNWYYLFVVYNGSTADFYVNGVKDFTTSAYTLNLIPNFSVVGAFSSSGFNFSGKIDDLEVSKTARNSAWGLAFYNITKSLSTTLTTTWLT